MGDGRTNMSLDEWGSGELLGRQLDHARRDHPLVAGRWQQATEAGQLILVQPMLMEVLYSAKNGEAAREELDDLRAAHDIVLIDDESWDLALGAQVRLAQVGNGYQRRFSITDLLTAALAHQLGLGILHYDADFDQIRDDSDLDFRSVWAAKPPCLESVPDSDPGADAKAL